MPEVRPFRPWKIVNPDVSIADILEVERKSDDRSQFVRYARATATWAGWIRESYVQQDSESSTPMLGEFRFEVVPIDSLIATQTVRPKDREDRQRMLEATQVYFDPIVVDSDYRVIAHHELHAAAVGLQEELARTGKVRASDYCLVAVTASPKITPQNLFYKCTQIEKLSEFLSQSNDKATLTFEVTLPENPETYSIPLTEQNIALFTNSLGAKTLDLGTTLEDRSLVSVKFPFPSNSKVKTPYDSFTIENVPPSGVIMWSLTDFVRS